MNKLFQLPASPPRPSYSARSELGAPSSVRASQPGSFPIKVSIFPSPTLPRNGQAQSLGKGEPAPIREDPDSEHQRAHPPPRPGAQATRILQRIGSSTPSLPSNGPRTERGEREYIPSSYPRPNPTTQPGPAQSLGKGKLKLISWSIKMVSNRPTRPPSVAQTTLIPQFIRSPSKPPVQRAIPKC